MDETQKPEEKPQGSDQKTDEETTQKKPAHLMLAERIMTRYPLCDDQNDRTAAIERLGETLYILGHIQMSPSEKLTVIKMLITCFIKTKGVINGAMEAMQELLTNLGAEQIIGELEPPTKSGAGPG